ncbi:hypothetical protein LMIY3S_03729 [Labrys miyagiensis]
MSSTTDKIKGVANQAAGSVREGAGKAIGNKEMEVKGAAQKAKGQIQEGIGKAKDAVKKAID